MSRYATQHETANLAGPGDSRPTALQILADEGIAPGSLKDRTIVITGTSSGIGIPTATALATTGAQLFCTARNLQKGRDALKSILPGADGSESKGLGKVDLIEMDQESLDSVKKAAKEILEKSGGSINVLICNAGVMAAPEGRTKDGYETQFGVNHIAHFAFLQLLLPALLSSAEKSGTPSRVVMLSSGSHKQGRVRFGDYNFEKGDYDKWQAYGQAKTANIWTANEVERRYGSEGVHATSVMPGGILTGLQWNATEMLPMFQSPPVKNFMKSPEQGAATTVWAAVGKEWEGKGGKYLENLSVAGAANPLGGCAEWAYDEDGAKRLWDESVKMTGLGESSV